MGPKTPLTCTSSPPAEVSASRPVRELALGSFPDARHRRRRVPEERLPIVTSLSFSPLGYTTAAMIRPDTSSNESTLANWPFSRVTVH